MRLHIDDPKNTGTQPFALLSPICFSDVLRHFFTGLCTSAQVAALSVSQEHNTHFDNLFKVWVNMLVAIIPQSTDIGRAYNGATSTEDQDFVQNLALFLTAFFKVQPSSPCDTLFGQGLGARPGPHGLSLRW